MSVAAVASASLSSCCRQECLRGWKSACCLFFFQESKDFSFQRLNVHMAYKRKCSTTLPYPKPQSLVCFIWEDVV